MSKLVRRIAAVVVAVLCVSSYSAVFASNEVSINSTPDLTVVATAAPTATVDSTTVPDATNAPDETMAPDETPKPNKNIRSGDFVYRIDEKTGEVIIRRYKGKGKKMVIPAEIDGHKITSFNPQKIYHLNKIDKIYIPETVTKIYEDPSDEGGYFLRWPNLKKIEVSKDNPVYESDRGVLIDKKNGHLLVCPDKNGLKKYVVPKNVKVIQSYAFSGNKNISHIYINHDGVDIYSYAFNAPNLKSLIIKGKTPFIGWGICSGCSKLETVKWKGGFKWIYDGSFSDCKKLKKIVIPSSVHTINEEAFRGCINLKEVIFEKNVKKIYSSAFNGCKNLKKIYWPKSAKKLDASSLPEGCKVIRK